MRWRLQLHNENLYTDCWHQNSRYGVAIGINTPEIEFSQANKRGRSAFTDAKKEANKAIRNSKTFLLLNKKVKHVKKQKNEFEFVQM